MLAHAGEGVALAGEAVGALADSRLHGSRTALAGGLTAPEAGAEAKISPDLEADPQGQSGRPAWALPPVGRCGCPVLRSGMIVGPLP
jgi:hypothetical protein